MGTQVKSPVIVELGSIWDKLSPEAQMELLDVTRPSEPKAKVKGMEWTEQQLREKPVLQLIRQMRGAARHGRLLRKEFDHNSPNYSSDVGSNKQVTIAATMVLGRDPVNYDEAWATIAELAFG